MVIVKTFKEMMNIVSLAKLSLALVVRQARAGHILATMVVSAFAL